MQEAPDGQISLTNPDARSLTWTGRARETAGYKPQAAVDAEHHLIEAHEVTNIIAPMALKAKAALGADHLAARADRGYYNAHQTLACEQNGIIPLVLKPLTSNSKTEGRFDKRDFIYGAGAGCRSLASRRAGHVSLLTAKGTV
ncbi:hypothetical protein [Stenotrophomonas sp. TWI1183]|uniref:hypothetical protein n=1 Tax=Stenotrophomonas sp. TWI1183 TaxID=3136799 RepID=UPI00320B3D52